MQKVRNALDACDDGCPNLHYTTVVASGDVRELRGHSLVCFNDGGCRSLLCILSAASTHYGVLRTLLNHGYRAIRSHSVVAAIDKALGAGDFRALIEITKVRDFVALLMNDLDSSYEQQSATVAASASVLRNVEARLLIKHAQVISDLEKEIDDDPEHACCSCERLHQRKSVTRVKLSDNLGTEVWPALKAYISEQNPRAAHRVLYMCNYCKPLIKKDRMPARCVLNGLQTVPIPLKLA